MKTISYSYTNVLLCSDFKSRTILVQPTPAFVCGSPLKDIRDNHIYPTVLIGSQCWMQANLDFGNTINEILPQTDNCLVEKYIHYSSFAYSSFAYSSFAYSSFYQWNELMQYDNTPATQGLCPPGWHIPSSAEFDQLLSFYNGPGKAGGFLKDTLFANGFQSHQEGLIYMNNNWAFTTGLPAGSMYWTSASSGADRAVARGLNEYNMSVSRYEAVRGNGFGVRCLKD